MGAVATTFSAARVCQFRQQGRRCVWALAHVFTTIVRDFQGLLQPANDKADAEIDDGCNHRHRLEIDTSLKRGLHRHVSDGTVQGGLLDVWFA